MTKEQKTAQMNRLKVWLATKRVPATTRQAWKAQLAELMA